MKNLFSKAIAITLIFMLILSFGGCSKKEKAPDDSNPVIDADASVEDSQSSPEESTPVESEPEESTPTESKPEEPVHVGVEKITLSKYSVTLMQGQNDMPIVTMHPSTATDKGEIWTSDNTSVATVNSIGRITAVGVGSCVVTVQSTDNPNVSAEVSVTVTPYVAPVEPEVTYINGILIANKTYALPSTYNPGADPTAKAALDEMFAAAKAEGLNLFIRSGFRSYATQKQLYNNYVKRDGVAEADRYSARPGHSEHQSGLGFDINKADSSFEGTPEAIWLAANCHKYGFIIRYPAGKESITGYMYEPWHVRYLGVEIATDVYNSGLCLEEYLGITSVYAQ